MATAGCAFPGDVLSVEVSRAGKEIRIGLRGELDLAVVEEARRALAGAGRDGQRVVVDVSALRFMDLSGLRLLLAAHQRLGDRLTLRGCSGQVHRLCELMGVTERLPLED